MPLQASHCCFHEEKRRWDYRANWSSADLGAHQVKWKSMHANYEDVWSEESDDTLLCVEGRCGAIHTQAIACANDPFAFLMPFDFSRIQRTHTIKFCFIVLVRASDVPLVYCINQFRCVLFTAFGWCLHVEHLISCFEYFTWQLIQTVYCLSIIYWYVTK